MSDSPGTQPETLIERRIHERRSPDARQDYLARLLAQNPDGIACIDRDWRIVFANAEAARIGRLTPADLHDRSWWELFPSDVGTPLEHAFRSVMESRQPARIEYFRVDIDIWLDVDVVPIDEGIAIYLRDITDRKGAELLRDSAIQQLHQVLEATTDAVISIDRAGTFTFLNRRAKELFAIKGDLLGKNFFDEFPAARLGAYLYHFNRALHEGIPSEFEDFYPDPLNRWLSFQLRPSVDSTIVFFRDITARKRNEEALVASEARYRVLADLNPQAIWMCAPDGTFTYANQSWQDYTGLTLETMSGTQWLPVFHPDDRTRVLESWTRSIATGQDYDIEARLIRASNGRSRWWWFRAQAIREESGHIINWLGVAIDIDDRRTFADMLEQRQEETERQRAELETIYQTAPIGLSLFDAKDFRYLRINDRQVEIIGLPKEQILGRVITDIIPIKGLKELLQRAASGVPVRNHLLEGELPGRPGEQRYWNVSYSPVFNAQGNVEAVAAVILEITNQKKAEIALIQSEKLAAVGRLASSISHEINNPLEAITNLLFLINLDENLPEAAREYIHTAQSELSRVCQIATQTLRFHRQAVRATRVTAADLVNAVLNLYQGRLANSSIQVDARYSTDTPILCFENDIRQVLNNLIANAIDAMRQGGRLLVRAHSSIDRSPQSPDGRRGIRITIADTGHGMSSAVQSRIFEPFYTTRDLNGTGLGLWISAGIVGRHQGRLTFRSTDHSAHHGTVFSLFLPLSEVPNPEPH